jgi:hypothetical protein
MAASMAAFVLAFSPAISTYAAQPQARASEMRPSEIRASKFIGSSVYDVQNRKIGSVKELLFDAGGRIDKVVVDVGAFLGMGGKLVAIGLSDIKADNNRLTLDMTKEQLKAAQSLSIAIQRAPVARSRPLTGRLITGCGRRRVRMVPLSEPVSYHSHWQNYY